LLRQVQRPREFGLLAGEVDCDLAVRSEVGRILERGVRTLATSTLWVSIATTTAATADDGDRMSARTRSLRSNGFDVTPARPRPPLRGFDSVMRHDTAFGAKPLALQLALEPPALAQWS